MNCNWKKYGSMGVPVMNASILLYILWLLIPAVQTTGRAMTGAFAVALFGLGAVMDWEGFQKHWLSLLARAACAAAMPIVLRVFLRRGGDNFAGFYVQQAMFWFPLVFAGYARERADRRMWRFVKWALLFAVCLTVLTTIGWLIQGMLRGGRVYAYSRSLGYAGEGREAYLKELMLRNIGGYDFVYAMVAALPLTCIGIQKQEGKKRAFFLALLCLQTIMIILSQYTYAALYAAAILAVEIFAWFARKLSKGKLSLGQSLLIGVLPLVLGLLLLKPMAMLAAQICHGLGLSNFAFSFEQLLTALQGGQTSADSRLGYYLKAMQGFKQSPLLGSLLGGERLLSYHSDLLDLLSGMGVVGAALAGVMVWLMGRQSLAGLRRHAYSAQLWMCFAAIAVTAMLGTVVYSRDILAVASLGALLVLENED